MRCGMVWGDLSGYVGEDLEHRVKSTHLPWEPPNLTLGEAITHIVRTEKKSCVFPWGFGCPSYIYQSKSAKNVQGGPPTSYNWVYNSYN